MNFDKLPEMRRNLTAARARRVRWVVFGAMVIVAAVAWGLNWMARKNDVRQEQRQTIASLRDQLAAAEKNYTDAVQGEAPLAERISTGELLLKAQRAFADSSPANLTTQAPAIRRTETELDRWYLELKAASSLEREAAAKTAAAAGDVASAETLWREAWQLQREVNRSGPPLRNIEREIRLEQEVMRVVAEPLQQKLQQALGRAQKAVAERQWEPALAAYREARELQDRLNREFPRTRFSDLAAIGRIDAEIASLSADADSLDARVNAKMEEARQLASSGQQDKAAERLAEAADAQRALNEKFTRSRFVSNERSAEIEAERQTALAAEQLREAARLRDEAEQHLRKREIFQAQQAIRDAVARVADVAARFPNARGLDDVMRVQLGFLDVRSSELAAIQDRLYDQLQPLPAGGAAMLRGELLQADFVAIMSANPSRNPGRMQPVDSVTFAEAEEFCRRASWVLGWRVRLPTADEMRAAAGSGFQNLTAGLDEWLAADSPAPNAPVQSAEGRASTAAKTERSRQRGFRVIVEVNLANPS